MRSHSQNRENSTDKAFQTHSAGDASAFSDASGASAAVALAHALSPSESDSPLAESLSGDLESEGERARARAEGHASDASGDASEHAAQDASGANASAPTHDASGAQPGKPQRRKQAASTPVSLAGTSIRPDWQPAPATLLTLEAEQLGHDLAKLALNFRDHHLGRGSVRVDWEAEFRTWCRKEGVFSPKPQQPVMMMPIAGQKPADAAPAAAPDDPAKAIGDSPDAQYERVKLAMKRHQPEAWSWLRKAQVVNIEDGGVTLAFPNATQADYVRSNFRIVLEALWQAENPAVRRLECIDASKLPKVGTG
jgi:hypothetical protein